MKLAQTLYQVEFLLKTIPSTRDSDITLTIELWKKYYPSKIKKGATGMLGIWLDDLHHLPSQDAIKRHRAHIQNDLKRYLPTTWKVAKKRKIKESIWLDYIRRQNEFKRI